LSVFYFPNLSKTKWWQLPDCGDLDDEVRTVEVTQSTVSLQVGYRWGQTITLGGITNNINNTTEGHNKQSWHELNTRATSINLLRLIVRTLEV